MVSSSRGRRPKAKKQKQKQKGLMRMDAALDHLMQLGFSKREITSTINSLIEVYGGDDCWVFIEEFGYKLVIDTILDNQKNNNKDHKQDQENQEEQEESQEEEEERMTDEDEDEQDENEAELAIVPTYNSPLRTELGEENQEQELDDDDDVIIVPKSQIGVILPGLTRAPCYGYLVETDSDSDRDNDMDH